MTGFAYLRIMNEIGEEQAYFGKKWGWVGDNVIKLLMCDNIDIN